MKCIRKLSVLALITIMVFLFTACSQNSQYESATPDEKNSAANDGKIYELTYATFNSSESGMYRNAEMLLIERLEEESEGRIKINAYPGGALLNGGEILEGVKSGSCDMGFDAPGWYTGEYPYTFLFEQPCGGPTSAKASSATFDEFVNTFDLEEYYGVVPLWLIGTGPASFTSLKPIRTLGDFAGKQIRSNAAYTTAVNVLGGTPVSMGMGEVYEAFKLNLIDAGLFSAEALQSFNLFEVASYATNFPFYCSTLVMVMNENTYDSLPKDLQQTIDQVSREVYEEQVMDFFDVASQDAIDYAKTKNPEFEVININEQEMALWEEKLYPLLEEYGKSLDDKGYKGTEMMEWMRERAEYYNELYSK